MKNWLDIKEDLDLTAQRPSSNLALHRAFVEANGITDWAFVPHRADFIPYILHNGRFPSGWPRYPVDGFDSGSPPGLDHGRIYRDRGRKAAYLVYHPYSLSEDERVRLSEWAGLADAVSLIRPAAQSWYYPGHTLLVIVAVDGVKTRW